MSPDLTMDCAAVRELAPEYVLGTLDEATAARLRAHLATCTEEHAELREIGGVIPYLAESLEPVEPRAQLKERLLAAARTARPLRVVPGRAPAPGSAAAGRATVRWSPPRRFAWALAAAALIVATALGATTLSLRN
jgi:anti-sigma factor RsiW